MNMRLLLMRAALAMAAITMPNNINAQAKAPQTSTKNNNQIPHKIEVSVVTTSPNSRPAAPHAPIAIPVWKAQTLNDPPCTMQQATWTPNMVSAPIEGACIYVQDAWSAPSPTKFNEWAYSDADGIICRNNIQTGITNGFGKYSAQIYAQNIVNQSRMQNITSSILSVRITTYYNHPSFPNGILTSVVWFDGYATAVGC
jgi:hypothetical protein